MKTSETAKLFLSKNNFLILTHKNPDGDTLGSAMKLRYTPELIFEIDHSIEYGAHINEVINSLEINHDGDGENEDQ